MTDKKVIRIKEGRHPIVEALITEPFVTNSISMKDEAIKVMILTGPNMGGKTSYARQVALTIIMAQIGSFVPCTSALIFPVDAVFTRMGAHDNVLKGQSTFYVELQETSHILHNATPNSLVILDELGRGTSTHDGVAIAYATLWHLVAQIKCYTLFITHYPILATIEQSFPNIVTNCHMAYMEDEDSSERITFLYKLTAGLEKRSYGLNVARLANFPRDLLQRATQLSGQFTQHIKKRQLHNNFKAIVKKSDQIMPEGITSLDEKDRKKLLELKTNLQMIL